MFSDPLKIPFTTIYITNCPGLVCFEYEVSTFFSGLKVSGYSSKPRRFTIGFSATHVNGDMNPVPKHPVFMMNPETVCSSVNGGLKVEFHQVTLTVASPINGQPSLKSII